jgi:hypothetical protein
VHRAILFVVCAAVLGGIGVFAEDGPTNSVARLKAVPPCAPLIAAAQANHIPLDQIDPPADDDRLDPGDTVTALITLFEKGGRRQWLVYLEVVPPNAEERAQKPAPSMVLYSSFGGTQECVSVPAFVVVRTLGPFAESAKVGKPGKAPEKTARFALNKGFLSLGLHHAAAAFHRFQQGPTRGTWSVGHKPFSGDEIAKGRELATRLQFTPEQERGLIGSIPALMSYFEVVQNSPGLSDIFFNVVDLPSAWSILRNRGIKSVGILFARKGLMQTSAALWDLPESASAYHFPIDLHLNDHPALNLTFVVTSPQPPLLASAGVVGLLAEKPDDPEKYLTLRILSARRTSFRKPSSRSALRFPKGRSRKLTCGQGSGKMLLK